MATRSSILPAILLIPALLSAAGTARAQNALGDGRALDRNLSATGDRINRPVKDINAQIRFNNQAFLGQAGAGRSFRGSVGYRATDEFRGSLGSDTLFEFRRDSIQSAAPTLNIRSSDALRYQFALAGGGTIDRGADPALFTAARGGGVATGAAVASMRSTSSFQARAANMPTVLGYSETKEAGRFAVSASPLRGVFTTSLEPFATGRALDATQLSNRGSLTGLERTARGVTALADVLSSAEQEARVNAIADRLKAGQALDPKPADPGSSYGQVIKQFTERLDPRLREPALPAQQPEGPGAKAPAKPETPARPAWEIELEKLRARINDAAARADRSLPVESKPMTAAERARELEERTKPRDPLIEKLENLPPVPDPDDSIIEALRKTQARLEALNLAPDDSDKQYLEKMTTAQAALGDGRYFDAEAQYSIALISKPADPMAQVGRVHAQIGASLFLSAAGNLRSLLTQHPELTPVRYAPALLPSKERAIELVERLLADLARKDQSALGQDGALILSYLGYQFDNKDWMFKGLTEMRARLTPVEKGGPREAFVNLVDRVWFQPPVP